MVAYSSDIAAPPRPALAALVVYLRPTPRVRLLRLLADLGIFVIEHQGALNALQTAFSTRSDFVIVVGDDDPEHALLARQLLGVLSSTLVAIVPAGAEAEGYVTAGATAVIHDHVPDEQFGDLLQPAVRQARWLRNVGRLAAEYVIFGDIQFRVMPPELVRQGRTVALTRVETEVLMDLSKCVGKPVMSSDLERRVASLSSREALHAGYLKQIVLRIRRKVDELGGNSKLLRSVRGIGYMLVS